MGHRATMSNTQTTLTAIQNASMNDTPMDDEALRAVFKALDPSNNGTIPADTFCKSLKIFGGDNAFTPEEISLLEKEMGMEASGNFNYIEFLELRKVLLGRGGI